jgi:aspartyl-tRNA(Asn)/glutamyl-tRNA(Gln) amidotransferase subunit B
MKTSYQPIIGLEVHAQLLTKTKAFCACANMFGAEPNSLTCPVCLGLPGALPVANQKMVVFGVMAALSCECKINQDSQWARKNYFYPDLPKGYQITQHLYPLAQDGRITIELAGVTQTIGISRLHLEEDAGKTIHQKDQNSSLVDFNRCGVPLIEIVSRPEMSSIDQAIEYLKELRARLMALGICDGNMEEGSFRMDANISLQETGSSKLGTRCEIKNMNSFRLLRQALEYEIKRQQDILSNGEEVVQETRLFLADQGITKTMRSKEELHDYRYFPEPDLPPLHVEQDWLEEIKSSLPELPGQTMQRLLKDYGLSQKDARLLVYNLNAINLFEEAVGHYNSPPELAKWIINEIGGDQLPSSGIRIAELVKLVEQGVLSRRMAKSILPKVLQTDRPLDELLKENDLRQISNLGQLEQIVKKVLSQNQAEAERFRAGEKKLRSFLVGQVMKESQGKADPKIVNQILNHYLG